MLFPNLFDYFHYTWSPLETLKRKQREVRLVHMTHFVFKNPNDEILIAIFKGFYGCNIKLDTKDSLDIF